MLSGSSKLIFTKGSLSGLKPSFYAFLVYLMPRLVQTSTAKGHSLKTCSVSQDSRSIVCS
ncbi:hypothetical protein ES319_D03G052700v1 [Gossypium barbadense]|uniref:Uncharacterized protein n=1 Tax=Gossypium barbadense TaxID=3634 RepID=A0A5J5S1E4_GOSBA|nr:hypothetical protein ES319_D03G052700v1 [Gossypium barbadense]